VYVRVDVCASMCVEKKRFCPHMQEEEVGKRKEEEGEEE
jgi:hypothetical protein